MIEKNIGYPRLVLLWMARGLAIKKRNRNQPMKPTYMDYSPRSLHIDRHAQRDFLIHCYVFLRGAARDGIPKWMYRLGLRSRGVS